MKTKKKGLNLDLDRFYCPKLGKDQKQKKVFARVGIEFLRPNSLQVQSQSSHFLVAYANERGLFLLFVQKFGLKSTKDGVFCKLCMPMEAIASGGFRGGDRGDASPPTSLKVTILAEKSALILNNSAPSRDASPPPT